MVTNVHTLSAALSGLLNKILTIFIRTLLGIQTAINSGSYIIGKSHGGFISGVRKCAHFCGLGISWPGKNITIVRETTKRKMLVVKIVIIKNTNSQGGSPNDLSLTCVKNTIARVRRIRR